MPLQKGDRAPEVTLPSTTCEQVPLAGRWATRPVVLLFFPLAFTSTCTKELCTVGDDLGSYTGLNADVIAVSVDSPFVLDRFRKDIGADYTFLSDFNRQAGQAFGIAREAPLGPGLLGANDRAVFVVGTDGTVAYAWHSANPGLLPPFDEIKAALEGLRSAA
jgi:peroxiredoxin